MSDMYGTPAQAAAAEHGALIADFDAVRKHVYGQLDENLLHVTCDDVVHTETLGHTRFEDGFDEYFFVCVTRNGVDRFYKVRAVVTPAEQPPAVTIAGRHPRHQHAG